jgi:predicted extracellular nuclease
MPAINLSSSYSQDFNSLLNTGTSNPWNNDSTLNGWYSNRTIYNAGTGSSNTGALYSFGSLAESDRSLGSVASGSTNTILYGVRLVNDTSTTISTLNIGFIGEQWRNGGNTTPQPLNFSYQIDANSLTTGTWTDFDALDFTSPTATATAGALDGNTSANRNSLSATLNNLSLAPGQEIWLRWEDVNDAGNDHGLGIDDFLISADIDPSTDPVVTVTALDSEADEPGNPGTFRITRTGDTSTELTVNYTVAGQATNGTDYAPNLTGTLILAANETFADITITPIDDSEVEGNETVTLTLTDAADYNLGGSPTATITITDNDTPPPVSIRDIQGTQHISPLVGTTVNNVAGIVTAVRSNGFYLQDPNPDNDEATSEGIFVFRGSSSSKPNIGDSVLVTGRVDEFRSSGRENDLSVTQINATVTGSGFTVVSTGNALPAAIILGEGGRIPPNQIIDNDAVDGNVENPATPFEPTQDGIDFYESLEGMRVGINNAVAVDPTSDFGEIPVLAGNGANTGERTSRGGIKVRAGDFNPERIIIDDVIVANEPQVNVGDRFSGTIEGVIDYSFSNFKFLNTSSLNATSGGLEKETTALQGDEDRLTVAAFNVENLSPNDSSEKFANLANRIVNNLGAPDILSLEEIQDNNGATNDSVVNADQTLQTLISAIAAAGGPTYEFRQINPVDDADGGQPGGNIRVGFLYNPNRVGFIDRPSGGSTTDTTVVSTPNGTELSASPGRIIDTDLSDGDAFANSRKPLVGEFLFNGNKVFVIGNHFNSKGGDQPLFGRFQPPTLTTEAQRLQQAREVRNFVNEILAVEPNTNLIVAGDLNDFEFSEPLSILTNGGLTNLIDNLESGDRYTYNFEGNAQVLDHILVSNNLNANAAPKIDAVHINSEFADQDSDHDPLVARFTLATLINGTQNPDPLGGSDRNEIINGLGGNDSIDGRGGNDTINGGIGNGDRLLGGSGNDVITDPDGVGGSLGGDGNDLLSITFAANWDNDTNSTSAPRSDGKITGGFGNDEIDVTMNNSRFFINLKGDTPVANSLDGNDAIALSGLYQNSVVDLGGGNDSFSGGRGSDNVSGKAGNDILLGLGGGDRLVGNNGNDTLTGGAGNDNLTGGSGQDWFTFFSPGGDRTDRIADFNPTDDTIGVDDAGFGGSLVAGTLLESQFVLGAAALDEGDRFIYNQSTGALFFDADGTGASAQVQLATLATKPVISFNDIVVI